MTVAVYSAAQLAVLAKAAGFSNTGQHDHALTWAVAIALAESRGRADASNLNSDGSIDRGLWQINSCHCPPYDPTSLFDPSYNADAAWAVSGHGTNFDPWVTFTTGVAATFYSQAAAGVAGMQNGTPVAVGSDVTTGTFQPAGGGSLFYQTVVWRHDRPTVVITTGRNRSEFH